jgi:hypothetical protein
MSTNTVSSHAEASPARVDPEPCSGAPEWGRMVSNARSERREGIRPS